MQRAPLATTSRSLVVAGHHVTQHLASLFEQLDQGWLRSVPSTRLLHQDLLAFAGMSDQDSLKHFFSVVGDGKVQEKLFFVLLAQSDDEACVGILRVNDAVVLFSVSKLLVEDVVYKYEPRICSRRPVNSMGS